MPEKIHRDNNGKAVQSIDPLQSSWLTHWTKARYESSTRDPSTHHDLDIKKHMSGVEIASDNFGSSKDIKDLDLAMSLKKPGTQSFPFFKRSHESKVQALEPQVSHKNSHHFQPEVVVASQIPTEQVKYHMFFGESSYYCSNPSKEKHMLKPNSVAMGVHEKSEMPSFLRQSNLLKTEPSTSNNPSPDFLEEQYKRMQKHIGMGFFPHQTSNQEMNKSFQNFPQFVHDMEMTGGIHGFSRTTHSLLITKQTDVELYQEKQIFRELNCSPPNFGHGQRGVKLQLLDSDQESQEKIEKNGKAAKIVQKNESSADNTMDMKAFKEDRLSGVHLSPQNKDTTVESNSPFRPPITKEKDAGRKRKIELPDINIEISNQPSSSSNSTQKTEPTTSRTQSLDMTTVQFNDCSDSTTNNHPPSHPENRWIKRLKLTSKKPKLLDQVHHKRRSELQIGESSSSKPSEITLSHSWIQRWSHDQGRKNVEAVENCKAGNPKLAAVEAEEYQKKQFPSIAAMALMGKAMTGFQQCKFQKKDSFVVWNTKGFE